MSAGPSRSPGARLAAALRRPESALLLCGLLLTAASWPWVSLEPQPGLDASWNTALHLSFQNGLDAGTQVLFSYGPLGFLPVPRYAFAWSTRLSWAYELVLHLAFCVALLWALRRTFGSLLVAAPIVLVIAALTFQEPVPVLIFAIAVCVLFGEVPARLLPWLLAGTGALVAVQLLAKLNIGIIAAALCTIALLGLGEGRRTAVAWFGGGLAVTAIACWLLSGQPPGAIGAYAGGSLQIISGYSEAMGLELPDRGWEIWAALALAAAGVAIIARAGPRSGLRTRLALTAMWLVLAFTALKEGFVRHDAGHVNIFFATMLGGLAALPIARRPRLISSLALLSATVVLLVSLSAPVFDLVEPLKRAGLFLEQGRTLADGSELNARIVAARERLKQAYALDPAIFAVLHGHSVHVDPYETNVPWAYQLEWKPAPVFQSYSAYTSALDERNAATLASPAGPERVLRQAAPAVDGRNPAWESPAAVRAMLCSFRERMTVAPWQVLERTANRCAGRRLLTEVRAHFGDAIAVPRAPGGHSVVYMTIDGVAVGGLERLATTAFRAQERHVTFDDGRRFRLVPGTADDGLIMRVPRAVDFSPPFALAQATDRFVVTRGTSARADGDLRVRFYAVDVR